MYAFVSPLSLSLSLCFRLLCASLRGGVLFFASSIVDLQDGSTIPEIRKLSQSKCITVREIESQILIEGRKVWSTWAIYGVK